MTKCRICLESKRYLISIFESYEGLSYASMITLVTGIKIVKDDYDRICLVCRRKLNDLYEFKQLIEQSELEICKQSKVFKFNSIDDIKEEFILGLYHENTIDVKNYYEKLFQNENNHFYYNDTEIRRLKTDEKKTILAGEILNSIKLEEFDDHNHYDDDYGQDSISNEEPNCRKKKEKMKKIEKCKVTDNNKAQKVRIKPTLLNDIRVVKTKSRRIGKKKNYSNNSRKYGICTYCGKFSKSVKMHILTHSGERNFKCNDCSRSFYTKSLLEYHMKTHFKPKEIFKCEHCISTFTSRGAVSRHVALHMKQIEFSCKVCEKSFKWKSGLRRHMMIHDLGGKSKTCDVCQMSFYTLHNLKHHLRVHTGERPFRCEICSQPYSYKRDFNRHCLKKHGIIIDRRPVYVMNEDILKKEKALMKDLMLRLHGMPTETEPMDSFQGPQKAQAFAQTIKAMKNGEISINVHL